MVQPNLEEIDAGTATRSEPLAIDFLSAPVKSVIMSVECEMALLERRGGPLFESVLERQSLSLMDHRVSQTLTLDLEPLLHTC